VASKLSYQGKKRSGTVAAALCRPVSEDYTSRLTALALEAEKRRSIRFLQSLPAEAVALDAECDVKLAELGVTGAHEVLTEDGRSFRVPEYFGAVAEAFAQAVLAGECVGHA
jgi:hypothetical protein